MNNLVDSLGQCTTGTIKLDRKEQQALLQCLDDSKSQQIILDGNGFGVEGAGVLRDVLWKLESLSYLDLVDNAFGVEGAGNIAGCLCQCKSLIVLKLRYNQFGDESVRRLALGQWFVKSLSYLDLAANAIGVEGTEVLGELLKKIKAL